MLTEEIFTAVCLPQSSASNSGVKEIGIYVHSLQNTSTPRATFKKSSVQKNCLAVSETHIFAAQSDKAVVHCYSRESRNLEALVSFPEKIHCASFIEDHHGGGVGILVLGTKGGRIILWEVATGRQVISNEAHLQAVTCITISHSHQHIITGSEDSNLQVWSLPYLLSFSPESNDLLSGSPLRALTNHQGGVTAAVVGSSSSPTNIVVSASNDKTCMVWDYFRGVLLRTVLLPSVALALTLDPADRAFYVGYEDGSVQSIDSFDQTTAKSHYENSLNPLEPALLSRWRTPEPIGAVHGLVISYDGACLVSSHESGHITRWDVGRRAFGANLIALDRPATNLVVSPPVGFREKRHASLRLHTVTKPRFGASLNASLSSDVVPGSYVLNAQILCQSPNTASSLFSRSSRPSLFTEALTHTSFPAEHLSLSSTTSLPMAEQAHADGHNVASLSALDEGVSEEENLRTANEDLKVELEKSRRAQKSSWERYCDILLEKARWQDQDRLHYQQM